jgi:nucleoside-diphosphate-sugar epimerase
MRIFLTGGTGFIGSHVVRRALAGNDTVVCLRRPGSRGSRIALEREPLWVEKGIDQVCADQMEGCDVLLHLASHTPNPPYDSLLNCLRWNLMEPLRLFEEAQRAGVKNFVVAGSCFEYGRAGERYEYIPANSSLEPTQTYSASKAAASISFMQWAREQDLSMALHRIFQVYGEGEEATRLWPSLRQRALEGADLDMTEAEQVRDFIAVTDVADQLIQSCRRLCASPGSIRELSNMGSGKPTTLRSFAEHWWQHWNATGSIHFGKLPYRNGEVMRYVPDLLPVTF